MSNSLNFFRSFLFLLILVVFTIFWGGLCLLFFFLPYQLRFYLASCWNRSVIWLARWLCGIRYQINGKENLPDEPVVLLSKHQSAWETIFLLYSAPRPLVFVMKKELLRIPLFGWALMLLRMIPIDRSQGTRAFRKVSEQGKQRLADGLYVAIFPEGTRTQTGERTKYRNSGSRLAIEAQSKVVPVALNSGACWPPDSLVKKPGLITISFGPAISSEGKTADALMLEVETWIESEMRRICPQSSLTADGT